MKLSIWMSLCMVTQMAFANGVELTKKVDFDVGNMHAIEHGSIQGFDKKNYQFYGHQGEKIMLHLDSVKAYFKLYSAFNTHGDTPLFSAETEGGSYMGVLRRSGIYTIQIYLGYKEAKKDTKAIYTLHIDRTH